MFFTIIPPQKKYNNPLTLNHQASKKQTKKEKQFCKNLPIRSVIVKIYGLYISCSVCRKYGINERTARNYCAEGKIEGAFLTGKTWNIPSEAALPHKAKTKPSPLLFRLRDEKEEKLNRGIYHRTQIDLTHNSNHIEGSRLTKEQTRYIFETNTIGITTESTSVDDIIETVNHFRCIDYVIDHATERISERHIKQLHSILKANTSQQQALVCRWRLQAPSQRSRRRRNHQTKRSSQPHEKPD